MKFVTAGALAASLILVGQAGAQGGDSHDPASVQPGTYAVETHHTQVLFDVDHMGITKYYGEFSDVTGSLVLDPKALSNSSVSVSIPVASISTTNLTLTGELKNPTWLDAATYPTITFVSKKVIPTSATTAKIIGDLTLHGVTRPVTLEAAFHGGVACAP
jgi:polyisoprenoid-binding protein YceI